MGESLPPIPNDPARRVPGGWNLGGAQESDDPLGDSLLAPPTGKLLSRRLSLPSGLRGLTGESGAPAPYHDFTFGPTPDDPYDSLLFGPDPSAPSLLEKPLPAVEPSRPVRGGTAAQSGTAASSMTVPPKPGEVIGGFRIVTELGRGAFARVYLAEQIDLGDRPVALKVSRAEGDEPQMLARLQHTHIVPIHSVQDDPETGLRLLCMPYLGGANLAQVLEAAGARVPDGPDRRSLVQALDEVSHRIQSGPASGVGIASRKGSRFASGAGQVVGSPSAVRRPDPPASQLSAARSSVTSPGHGSASRFNGLWTRIAWRRRNYGELGAATQEGQDFDQPARQFLREANAIQAAVWIIARLAEGLEHAHSRGLLHRDLKPSNILIAADGTPMLLDFNLSTGTEPSDAAEGEKAMLGGTLPYMSPEHLDAFDPQGTTSPDAVNERSDLYSLGLILFEMIAGDHPFPEPPARLPLIESIRFMTQQRRKPPSLRASHPGVPWSLDSIVRKCIDPDPARRYARARDLADDLNRFLDDRPLRHAPEVSPRESLAKWARRNPRLCGSSSIAALAALLICSLGGLIGLLHVNMQNLSTRLKLQVFRDDFTECRFLLNLASGPAEHLGRGIALADRTLDQLRIDPSGDWKPGSWVRRLTAREQVVLREQTSELILLEARGRVYLAERRGNEVDRRKALEWAVPWLDRAERLDTAPPAALYADRARYHSALGESELAAIDRSREAAKVPVSSRDFSLLGTSLLAGGDVARAEPALLKAVDLDPRSFWAWFALGHCHYDQGRIADAAGDFAVCVALEPKFAWPHMNRGLALARVGRLTEAKAEYARALEASPRFAEAWVNLALVELELGDLAATEKALEEARALGRRETAVYAVLAEVKARQGNREAAETLFAQLLGEHPDDPVLLTARGIFRIADDPAAARRDLRRAIKVEPRNARAHFGMALLVRRESPQAALEEVDAALASDPNLFDALQLRALLRARLGDLAAADDVERLIQLQTPHRLYNAACALALLVEHAGETRLASRAVDLLKRSLAAGFPPHHALIDPDLNVLRKRNDFPKNLDKSPPPLTDDSLPNRLDLTIR